ncbi:MAG TPA: hypothetical protein VNN79_23900 [Actinomycetota bacterium]|nr:hypothetical protein [Actinomycetota bacterium]
MALAITLDTPRSRNVTFIGGQKVRRGLMNLGNPYVVGGVSIGATEMKALGLRTLDHLDVGGCSVDGAITVMYDKANQKIKAFTAFGTEAGAVDLSAAGKNFRFEAEGK